MARHHHKHRGHRRGHKTRHKHEKYGAGLASWIASRGKRRKKRKHHGRKQHGGKSTAKRPKLALPPDITHPKHPSVASSLVSRPEMPVSGNIQEITTEELAVDYIPPVRSEIYSHHNFEVDPRQGPETDTTSYQFDIDRGPSWFSLSDLRLHLDIAFTDMNGNDLAVQQIGDTAPNVGKNYRRHMVETNLLHSIWLTCELKINNFVIKWNMQHYNIFAAIMTILTVGERDSETAWAKSMYEMDNHRSEQLADPAATNCWSEYPYKKRRIISINRATHTVSLCDSLYHPMLQQAKLLPPGSKVVLKLGRAPNNMVFNSPGGEGVKVVIKKINLTGTRYHLTEKAQERMNTVNLITYPIQLYEEVNQVIQQNARHLRKTNLIEGRLPSHIIAVFVDNRAFNGNYSFSILDFKNCGLSKFALIIDGEDFPGPNGYNELTLGTNEAQIGQRGVAPYLAFMAACRRMRPDSDVKISYADWCRHGNSIFVFDLATDNRFTGFAKDEFSKTKDTPVGVNLKFREALPQTSVLMLFAGYDQTVKINPQNRNVDFMWM